MTRDEGSSKETGGFVCLPLIKKSIKWAIATGVESKNDDGTSGNKVLRVGEEEFDG